LNIETWINPEFWGQIARETMAWSLRTAPRILVLALGLFLALKVLRLALRRLRVHVVSRNGSSTAEALEHEKRLDTLIGIARKVAVIAIWSMFAMLLLVEVGINVGPLIAGAGVLGLAVGFGAQELVRDVISGFFMLLENHLRNGDVAIINGTGGLVESIGLRTITLRDLSGTVHVFQNGKINTLANMTKEWSAIVFDIRVAYKEDTDKVIDVMREAAEGLRQDEKFGSKILEPMEIFGVDALGESAVIIKARLKTIPIEQWSVGREYRRRLKYAFDKRGIEIPFPHRTLYWADQANNASLEPSTPRGHVQRAEG
jgi:small conductance mechanosensitive channel